MKLLRLSVIVLVAFAGVARAQVTSPLQQRANEVAAQFRPVPGDYDKLFAPGLLAQVPPAQFSAIFLDYFSKLGRCTEAKLVTPQGPNAGRFDFVFERGYSLTVTMKIDNAEPHLVTGILLGTPIRLSKTLEEVVNDLKALPGQTNFLVAKLSNDGITPLIAHNSDSELAIGSAFKLYILSELVRSTNARERKWSDVVALDENATSLPSGMLQTWPAASPLTLHTLATLMISISDNTAADQLLATLGRERVEQMLRATAHTKPELDMPFLSTLEMFKLKGEPTGKAAAAYVALDVKGRRAFLADTIAKVKREDTKPFQDAKPAYVDKIEWFASAGDLCRLMNWLRRETEGDATARRILAINPGSGLTIPREKWQYVGYKGGSEPGVLNMTYLLQSKTGDWYAFSMSWNNQQAALENEKIFGLVQRVLQLIQ
jgi:hypothetical protein